MTYPTKDGLAIHTGNYKVKEGTFEQEFEVEKVPDARGTPHERFYLIQWKNLNSEFNTWQNWREPENAMDEITTSRRPQVGTDEIRLG